MDKLHILPQQSHSSLSRTNEQQTLKQQQDAEEDENPNQGNNPKHNPLPCVVLCCVAKVYSMLLFVILLVEFVQLSRKICKKLVNFF